MPIGGRRAGGFGARAGGLRAGGFGARRSTFGTTSFGARRTTLSARRLGGRGAFVARPAYGKPAGQCDCKCLRFFPVILSLALAGVSIAAMSLAPIPLDAGVFGAVGGLLFPILGLPIWYLGFRGKVKVAEIAGLILGAASLILYYLCGLYILFPPPSISQGPTAGTYVQEDAFSRDLFNTGVKVTVPIIVAMFVLSVLNVVLGTCVWMKIVRPESPAAGSRFPHSFISALVFLLSLAVLSLNLAELYPQEVGFGTYETRSSSYYSVDYHLICPPGGQVDNSTTAAYSYYSSYSYYYYYYSAPSGTCPFPPRPPAKYMNLTAVRLGIAAAVLLMLEAIRGAVRGGPEESFAVTWSKPPFLTIRKAVIFVACLLAIASGGCHARDPTRSAELEDVSHYPYGPDIVVADVTRSMEFEGVCDTWIENCRDRPLPRNCPSGCYYSPPKLWIMAMVVTFVLGIPGVVMTLGIFFCGLPALCQNGIESCVKGMAAEAPEDHVPSDDEDPNVRRGPKSMAMRHQRPCLSCERMVPGGVTVCPHCGEDVASEDGLMDEEGGIPEGPLDPDVDQPGFITITNPDGSATTVRANAKQQKMLGRWMNDDKSKSSSKRSSTRAGESYDEDAPLQSDSGASGSGAASASASGAGSASASGSA